MARLVVQPCGPPWLQSWLQRHQSPSSFILHVIGVPMTMIAVPFVFVGRWPRAAGLFAGGYALQFLGHALEGNPPGELVAVRRLLRRR